MALIASTSGANSIVGSATYPFKPDAYASTEIADIRTFAAANSIIPSQNGGEDNKDYKWRVAKAIGSWMNSNFPWNGVNSASTNYGNGAITALNDVGKKSLYMGGAFTACGTLTKVLRIAELGDTASFHVCPSAGINIDPSGVPGTYGVDGTVNCMVLWTPSGGTPRLVIGGSFTKISQNGIDTTCNGVAQFDGFNWTALTGSGITGVGTGGVNALAVYNNNLYVGGAFTTLGDGSTSALRLAKFTGSAWSAVGANTANGAVRALFVFGGLLWIGGQFSTPSTRIMTWNDTTLANGYASAGPATTVFCFGTYNSTLFVGGQFVAIDGAPTRGVAKWNGSQWVATSATGITNAVQNGTNQVKGLYQNGSGNLIAVGNFSTTNGVAANFTRACQWDGNAWSACGTAPGADSDSLTCVLYHQGTMYVGKDNNSGSGSPKYLYTLTGAGLDTWTSLSGFDAAVNCLGEMSYHYLCGNIAAMMLGLCVAHGIYTRYVLGTSSASNADAIIEVYDPRVTNGVQNGWALFFCNQYGWIEDANGVPQSLQRIKDANDAGYLTFSGSKTTGYTLSDSRGASGFVIKPVSTMISPGQIAIAIPAWCGCATDPGGVETNKLLYHNSTTYSSELNVAGGSIQYVDNYNGGPGTGVVSTFSDVGVTYPIANMTVVASVLNATTARITPTVTGTGGVGDTAHNFVVDHYEASSNGGTTWSTITLAGGNYDWSPATSGTLLVRAVTTHGATSPNTSVTFNMAGGGEAGFVQVVNDVSFKLLIQ